MKKKILSGLLALALIFGSAAALPKDVFTDSTSITASAESAPTSGKCGENLSWSLDSKGVLTISGTGDMYDFKSEASPFFGRNDIKSVVIKSGVTSIEDTAFYDCHNLKSVTFPNSLKRLGVAAFSGCRELSSITIPSSVTSIGTNVFNGCVSLSEINVENGNVKYGSVDGILYNKDKTELITCPEGKKGDISLPSGVKRINDFSFTLCKNITSVKIPNGTENIGDSAFEQCNKLSSINIPNSIKSIGSRSFFECYDLKSITIPGSVKSIGVYAFYNCISLAKVNIPQSMTTIEGGVFMGCDSLTEISIPNGIKSIDSSAFFNCGNLASVTIPKSVTEIGSQAFGYYWGTKVDGFTVIGYTGSAAEKYAKDNGFMFRGISRLAGEGRYATAVEISKAGFPSGSDTVILAYSMNYADALAGVPLAKAMNAPILLTTLKTLPAETLAEIERLNAKKVIILGGTSAVSADVEKALTDKKLEVERIAGKTRFETAAKIADKMQQQNENKAPTDVFFVYYNGFADALSVSAAAAVKGAPIVYLTTNGALNADTAAYLADLKKAGSVKNAYVIGGTSVISDDMATKAANALGLAKATRVAGADRFETCVAVNEKFADVLGGDMLCVATGMDFPDALAGGVYAANNNAPLFLINGKLKTSNLNDKQKAYLIEKKPSSITAFGGTSVVPDDHIEDIAKNSI